MITNDKNGLYSSGELARLVGVSADTLRHYERKRVLTAPRRMPNGYRQYSLDALERVRLVRRAVAVGFTLDELAKILEARDRGGAPCRSVRATAAAKLESVEAQLRDLSKLRRELRDILKEWDALLANSQPGKPVHLLEALASRNGSPGRKAPTERRIDRYNKRKSQK